MQDRMVKVSFMKQNINFEEVAVTFLPTAFGEFDLHVYKNGVDESEHVALTTRPFDDLPLVRIQSECLTGEVFCSLRCDCRDQIEDSMKILSGSGNGIFIYLRQHEGRGIGLVNKIRAYDLQDQGLDTITANNALGFNADLRSYENGISILKNLGITKIKLLTNNLDKVKALEDAGIKVIERLPLQASVNRHNLKYLQAKRDKLDQIIDI